MSKEECGIQTEFVKPKAETKAEAKAKAKAEGGG
jgi:hypothetical protein